MTTAFEDFFERFWYLIFPSLSITERISLISTTPSLRHYFLTTISLHSEICGTKMVTGRRPPQLFDFTLSSRVIMVTAKKGTSFPKSQYPGRRPIEWRSPLPREEMMTILTGKEPLLLLCDPNDPFVFHSSTFLLYHIHLLQLWDPPSRELLNTFPFSLPLKLAFLAASILSYSTPLFYHILEDRIVVGLEDKIED